jgi:hypothetical protein
MNALTHFALGLTIAVLALVPVVERFEDSTVLVVSGIWALGPDLSLFVRQLQPLSESIWSNVFWFHGLVDAMETGYPNLEAFVALTMLLTATTLTERRN